jgi:purine-binding chemotaxis protein CheW
VFLSPTSSKFSASRRPSLFPWPRISSAVWYITGEVLTAVSLRRLLGMEASKTPEDVLVFENPDGLFGLFVDSVGEVLHVSAADHEPNPATLEARRQALFDGAWKLKDRLLVSLEPERLDPMRLASSFPA